MKFSEVIYPIKVYDLNGRNICLSSLFMNEIQNLIKLLSADWKAVIMDFGDT